MTPDPYPYVCPPWNRNIDPVREFGPPPPNPRGSLSAPRQPRQFRHWYYWGPWNNYWYYGSGDWWSTTSGGHEPPPDTVTPAPEELFAERLGAFRVLFAKAPPITNNLPPFGFRRAPTPPPEPTLGSPPVLQRYRHRPPNWQGTCTASGAYKAPPPHKKRFEHIRRNFDPFKEMHTHLYMEGVGIISHKTGKPREPTKPPRREDGDNAIISPFGLIFPGMVYFARPWPWGDSPSCWM